jgi:23S rRNA (uracil1939-C5)-methyltransferase
VVFVHNTAPGDHVRIELIEDHKRYAEATAIEILRPSAHRVNPSCPYHASCGGCPWQHLHYDEQCLWKRRILIDALQRIGGLTDASTYVQELYGSERIWGYRNKIELEAGLVGKALILGFHPRQGTDLVAVESCKLLPRTFRDAPRRITGALSYACREMLPDLVRVGIRVSEKTGDLALSLWTKPCRISRELVARVLNDAVRSTSITRVIVDGSIKERKVKQVEVLAGRGYWRESLDNRVLKLSAPSFFQVNTPAAKLLLSTVLDALSQADIAHRATIADLYAGAGTFTLALAARFENVVAVESYGSSIRDLRRNLEDNHLYAEVIGGDVARELPTIGAFDAAVIDPPRSGLSAQALNALAAARPRAIVYVSCNPSTLARDVKAFVDAGYKLAHVRPLDLFPQSYHIESVSLLLDARQYGKAKDAQK